MDVSIQAWSESLLRVVTFTLGHIQFGPWHRAVKVVSQLSVASTDPSALARVNEACWNAVTVMT